MVAGRAEGVSASTSGSIDVVELGWLIAGLSGVAEAPSWLDVGCVTFGATADVLGGVTDWLDEEEGSSRGPRSSVAGDMASWVWSETVSLAATDASTVLVVKRAQSDSAGTTRQSALILIINERTTAHDILHESTW